MIKHRHINKEDIVEKLSGHHMSIVDKLISALELLYLESVEASKAICEENQVEYVPSVAEEHALEVLYEVYESLNLDSYRDK
jgi:hypothetical protein